MTCEIKSDIKIKIKSGHVSIMVNSAQLGLKSKFASPSYLNEQCYIERKNLHQICKPPGSVLTFGSYHYQMKCWTSIKLISVEVAIDSRQLLHAERAAEVEAVAKIMCVVVIVVVVELVVVVIVVVAEVDLVPEIMDEVPFEPVTHTHTSIVCTVD